MPFVTARTFPSEPRVLRLAWLGLLLAMASSSLAQINPLTILAGTPSAGYVDATGSAARFNSSTDLGVNDRNNVYTDSAPAAHAEFRV